MCALKLICLDSDGVSVNWELPVAIQFAKTRSAMDTCPTLCPSDSELLIECTHKHTSILTLPSQLLF